MTDFFGRFFRKGRAPGEGALPPATKRPAAGEAEINALAAAGAWLNGQSIAHARAMSLGEERRFDFDQDSGLLTLRFADGAALSLEGQIIASFQPRNRSFRWSWANKHVSPALARAASAARDDPATCEFSSFRTEMFEVKFEDGCRIAALAASTAGCDGVYRCLTDDSLTIFVGYRAAPLAPLPSPPSLEQQAAATAQISAWDAAMFPFDVEYRALGRDPDPSRLSALQAGQLEVYRRFWRRDDDYWEPCSFGWPSDHDPARLAQRFAAPRRAGGVYVISQGLQLGYTAHVVSFVDGQPFITDQDLDWGRGVLLDCAS